MKGNTALSYLHLENEKAWVRSYEASAGKLQPAGLNEQISSDRRRLKTDGPFSGLQKDERNEG